MGWFQAQYHMAFLTANAVLGFISGSIYGIQSRKINSIKCSLATWYLNGCSPFWMSDFKMDIEKLMHSFRRSACLGTIVGGKISDVIKSVWI